MDCDQRGEVQRDPRAFHSGSPFDLPTKSPGMLLALPNPAHAIVGVAAYAGLSKSEIEGLCCENYNGKEINVICGRVHGVFDEPRTVKRKAAEAVIPRLRKILDKYELSCGDPATGVMFANGSGNRTA